MIALLNHRTVPLVPRLLLGLVFAAAAQGASAQAYPAKPIHLLVPYAPGGT